MSNWVLAGAVDFSRTCLEEMIALRTPPVGVVALDPDHASRHSDYCDLGPVAERHGIPVLYCRDINSAAVVARLRIWRPDLLMVWGWSQLVKPEIMELPSLGCLGAHPSLLPRHRGRHPIIWTLVNGEPEGGLTFFWLDAGADSGDIIAQERFVITLEDTAATVYAKVCAAARKMLRDLAPVVTAGDVPRTPQDDSQADYLPKRTAADGAIDWSLPALTVHNLIRALTRPYPGAHSYRNGEKIIVWHSRWTERETGSGAAGTVLAQAEHEWLVACGDRPLRVAGITNEQGIALAPATGERWG